MSPAEFASRSELNRCILWQGGGLETLLTCETPVMVIIWSIESLKLDQEVDVLNTQPPVYRIFPI